MKNEITDKIRVENMQLTQKLIKIGKTLSLEPDIKKVFKIILDEVIEVTSSDRGVIYITSHDNKYLQYERVKTISQNQELDAEAAARQWQSIMLYKDNHEPVMNSLATFVYHTGFEAHFDDVYDQDFFSIEHTRMIDNRDNYHSQSMIAIPLVDHEENVLGIIELTNSSDTDGNIIPFSDEHIEILLSVASQAAITLSNKLLIQNLEKMIFDFTQAIAYAIDMKSDNSYQHVQKVAILTNMLANEINSVDDGAYAQTKFSRDELDEIAISGWLHDLGKIATSDLILNKNTKLSEKCDKIDYIQLKFELIDQIITNKINSEIPDIEKKKLSDIQQKLPEYFDLIKQINIGSEFLSEDVVQILLEIAAFSIDANGKCYKLIEEHELENLMVKRGTLNHDEYEEIKKHAELTFSILSKISFPNKFKNVPMIAGSHHERINGTGYPNGLKDKEIPLQSRILAIADVFDALMSKRAYKDTYGLNKSLEILARMASSNELDKDLLDIILDRKIYLAFAGQYNVSDFSHINVQAIKEIYRG